MGVSFRTSKITMNPVCRRALVLIIPLLFSTRPAQAVTFDYSFENSNIISIADNQQYGDFNRLRTIIQIDEDTLPQLSVNLEIDYTLSSTEAEQNLDHELELYRGTIEYSTDRHLLVAGRQRIPFGVGRIWNPIDIFNPIDSTALEPGERRGVDGIRYEYGLSPLAGIDLTLARNKASGRLKGFLGWGDLAVLTVINTAEDQVILGWEIEGELGTSGIEIRSEGGSFYDREADQFHTELIIGAEYGFPSSLTLLVEYSYNDFTTIDQLGMTLGYQLSTLLQANLLAILNLDDHSSLLAPTLSYSLSDEMTLEAGFFLYSGKSGDGFGEMDDMIFLKWFVHF